MTKVTGFVGQRVLVTFGPPPPPLYHPSTAREFRVLEVSPSGVYVRLQNEDGRKLWHAVQNVQMLEVLGWVLPRADRAAATAPDSAATF